MASTYTDSLRLELMATGEKSETWGTVANTAVFELLEDALVAETSINTTGGTTTLTTNNGAVDQARAIFLDISGTLVSNATITAPAKPKLYVVRNGTSGAFTVTIEPSGGTGITVTQGETALLYLDGTNTIGIGNESFTITTFGKSLVDDTDAATARTTLGLADFADKTAANEFTADQTIKSTDSGDAEGPALDLHRDSSTPADNDKGPVVRFKMEDDADNEDTFAKIGVTADDVSSTTEDGHLTVATVQAGTLADRVHVGGGVYTAGVTGGDQGAGTINAGTLYQGGTAIIIPTLLTEATLTGATVDFTSGIPSTAVRLTIMVDGASTDTTDEILVRLGDSGGFEDSGYVSKVFIDGNTVSVTNGFQMAHTMAAAETWTGMLQLVRMDTNNTWIANGMGGGTTSTNTQSLYGSKTLSGTLDRVRIMLNGAGSFDAGTVNILVE